MSWNAVVLLAAPLIIEKTVNQRCRSVLMKYEYCE